MFLAVVDVLGDEFMAKGESIEDAYRNLENYTDCNPKAVEFFELKPCNVKAEICFISPV